MPCFISLLAPPLLQACLLLLSVLDLPSYVSLMSSAPPGPSAPTTLDDLVPLGGKVRGRCFRDGIVLQSLSCLLS